MKPFITHCLLLLTLNLVAQSPAGKYQVLTGKVGETDATLHLQLAGNKAAGYIWFAKTPMPMYCYTDYNPAQDSLVINANANPLSLTLTGVLKGNNFSGSATLEKDNSNGKTAAFNLQASTDTVYTGFSVHWQEVNLKMPARLVNESAGSYYGSAVWPLPMAGKKVEGAIKANISQLMGNQSATKDAAAFLAESKNKFAAGWNATNAKLKPADTKDMGLSLSQEAQQQTGVMYEDSRVILLYHFNYSFTGGAHGNYLTTVRNIDKRTGNLVKLSDVLTPQGIQALPAMLEAVVRMQYGLDKTKSLEENGLLVKTILPSENFYITNGNLGFFYSTYAIMAYAYGEPNLFVPASAIARYIKPAYSKQ